MLLVTLPSAPPAPAADAYLPFAFAVLSWGPGLVALLIGIASAWLQRGAAAGCLPLASQTMRRCAHASSAPLLSCSSACIALAQLTSCLLLLALPPSRQSPPPTSPPSPTNCLPQPPGTPLCCWPPCTSGTACATCAIPIWPHLSRVGNTLGLAGAGGACLPAGNVLDPPVPACLLFQPHRWTRGTPAPSHPQAPGRGGPSSSSSRLPAWATT